jgi:hypothetical protein
MTSYDGHAGQNFFKCRTLKVRGGWGGCQTAKDTRVGGVSNAVLPQFELQDGPLAICLKDDLQPREQMRVTSFARNVVYSRNQFVVERDMDIDPMGMLFCRTWYCPDVSTLKIDGFFAH